MRFPVARESFSPHRYWLRFSTEITIITEARDRFEAGDLVLLETDPAAWAEGPSLLESRLCAIRLHGQIASQHVLARWGREVKLEGSTLVFETGTDDSTTCPSAGLNASVRYERALTIFDEEEEQGGPAETQWTVTVSDVVAVAVMMVRMLDASQ